MIYVFGDYELDTGRHELRRAGETRPTEPQVFDLLLYLVRHADRTISRDELHEAIWQGRFVSESSLGSRINAARRAIGDDGKRQAMIRTIPRRGFSFVGEVKTLNTSGGPVAPDTDIVETGLAPPFPDKPSIAVLPFDNMSGDPEQSYFADGMADEIITALSHVEWLFVIARNSSFAFRNKGLDVREIGLRLGVRYLLEGSVRRAGGRVRITAQLIEAASGSHLWAQRYEGGADEVFELQDRITESVVGAVQPKLRAAEIAIAERKRPENLEAYDHLLRALPHSDPQSMAGIERAEQYLNEALALDSNYAEALALAAWCRATRPIFGMSRLPEADYRQALELAERALASDPESVSALCYAGYTVLLVQRDYETAYDLYTKALSRNPSSALAYRCWGWTLNFAGENESALEKFVHGLRLSPSDPQAYQFELGQAFAHAFEGSAEEAHRWARRSLQANPEYLPNYRVLVAILTMMGRNAEAETMAAELLDRQPGFTVGTWAKAAPLRGTPGQKRMIAAMIEGGLPA